MRFYQLPLIFFYFYEVLWGSLGLRRGSVIKYASSIFFLLTNIVKMPSNITVSKRLKCLPHSVSSLGSGFLSFISLRAQLVQQYLMQLLAPALLIKTKQYNS